MEVIRPYCAIGQLDPETLSQLTQGFGPGHKLKVRCPKCRTRVRRWRLPALQAIGGLERSVWACRCALTLQFSDLAVSAGTWEMIATVAERAGYLEVSDAASAPLDKLRPVGALDLRPPLWFSNS